MNKIFKNKYVLAAIGILVVGALFLMGKHEEAGTSLATVGLVGQVELTAAEKEGMNEAEQKMLGERLADPSAWRGDPGEARAMSERFAAIEVELLAALERWESLEARR